MDNTDEVEEGMTYMHTQTLCTHRCNLCIQEDRTDKAKQKMVLSLFTNIHVLMHKPMFPEEG